MKEVKVDNYKFKDKTIEDKNKSKEDSPTKKKESQEEPKKEVSEIKPIETLKEKPKEDFTLFWQEIERGFISLKKEFSVIYGFCITRPGLPSSNFISYMIPHIDKLGITIQSLFGDLGNYEEAKFKLSMIDFNRTKTAIELEIENVRDKIQRMDPFDKLVDKFIRLISNYLIFINNKIIEFQLKKKAKS